MRTVLAKRIVASDVATLGDEIRDMECNAHRHTSR